MTSQSSRLTDGHTEGPWKLCVHLADPEHDKKCGCGYRGGIWSADGETIICEMGGSPEIDGNKILPEAPRAQQLADAALIALAPTLQAQRDKLVEALSELVEHFASVMDGPMIAGAGIKFANGVEGIPTIVKARSALREAGEG